jgi:lactate permease
MSRGSSFRADNGMMLRIHDLDADLHAGGDSLLLSALVAAIPVLVLLGLLAAFHVRAHLAALAGLGTALLIAVVVYGMPTRFAAMAAVYGGAFGLFPIGWIVLNAIFVYDVTVHTGQFEIVKRTIAGLADDRRIQVLLIAFSFGAFIEGAAGFGAPVAITAAMLIGLGFRPLPAAGLSLIGNTAPVAFGSLGIPIITLAQVTQLDLHLLSQMVGRQLPFFSLIVPFWLIWAMAGWRGMLEVWPACAVTGIVFGSIQFLVSNYHGPWVVDIAGRHRGDPRADHPPEILAAEDNVAVSIMNRDAPREAPVPVTRGEAVKAWAPWAILSLVVFAWASASAVPAVKSKLDLITPVIKVPSLHERVMRARPLLRRSKGRRLSIGSTGFRPRERRC